MQGEHNTVLIKMINYKRVLKTPSKFIAVLTNYKKLTSQEKKLLEVDHLRNQIQAFDVGGYFIDKNDNICLIFDTYWTKEETDEQVHEFMRKYGIPLQCLEYIECESDLQDPPNFYTIHRPNVYIIRLKPMIFMHKQLLGKVVCDDMVSVVLKYL